MKTLQKTIWITCLIIGILLNSCGDPTDDRLSSTHFNYVNQTEEPLELKMYNNLNVNFRNYSIPAGSTISIEIITEGSIGVAGPFQFNDGYAEKVVIRFETSNKCLINYPKIKNESTYDNFTKSMYNTSNNTLIYNIDSEELDLATPCL